MAATYRLLLDETIEHEVMDRLTDAGHDVEHVATVADLGPGAPDAALAAYSADAERAIVTYDDDFIEDVPTTAYRAVLFLQDDTLTANEVAPIGHAMAELYPDEEVVGLQKTGRQWVSGVGRLDRVDGWSRRHPVRWSERKPMPSRMGATDSTAPSPRGTPSLAGPRFRAHVRAGRCPRPSRIGRSPRRPP